MLAEKLLPYLNYNGLNLNEISFLKATIESHVSLCFSNESKGDTGDFLYLFLHIDLKHIQNKESLVRAVSLYQEDNLKVNYVEV
jgi:hypothetical protein